MHTSRLHDIPLSLTWHLPEAEWHDATLELPTGMAPSGLPIDLIDVDETGYPVDGGHSDHPDGPVSLRLRLPRHDGPRAVTVQITDTAGRYWRTVVRERTREW